MPVGDYLTRGDMRALDRACISKSADKGECKRAALNLYRGLPDTVRRRVEGKKVSHVLACPALSPEAPDRPSPGTRCARRT